jgi:hypothetical protein
MKQFAALALWMNEFMDVLAKLKGKKDTMMFLLMIFYIGILLMRGAISYPEKDPQRQMDADLQMPEMDSPFPLGSPRSTLSGEPRKPSRSHCSRP